MPALPVKPALLDRPPEGTMAQVPSASNDSPRSEVQDESDPGRFDDANAKSPVSAGFIHAGGLDRERPIDVPNGKHTLPSEVEDPIGGSDVNEVAALEEYAARLDRE